jgi:phosphotransferase family enzyme
MPAPAPTPSLSALATGLASVLNHHGSRRGPLEILRRNRSRYSSTFPSEIVTCKFPEGGRLRLLCKYAGREFYTGHGHRGGVVYEAEVYRRILQPAEVSTPEFHGVYADTATGGAWLVLEYLSHSERVNVSRGGMIRAARWIGRFHALQEARVGSGAARQLKRYDAAYYRGWVQRTLALAGDLHARFPWLERLCARFEEKIPVLTGAPQTVIHGEYYPANILVQAGTIRPVDWESAAVGPGEIDLGSLTEGWDARTTRRCVAEYCRSRWPEGADAGFRQRLEAARLYFCFRWLGDSSAAILVRRSREYFALLRSLGVRLGLL